MDRSSLKLLLKLVNALFGALGLFLLVFGIWVLKIWQREVDDGSTPLYPIPWFVFASIGVGVGLCLMTWIGYMAAHTANAFWISFMNGFTQYLVIIFVLMVFEVAFAADVYSNSNWEKDLPEDSTGMLDDIADYIKSNTGTFRWVALSIVFAQVLSVLLTVMLRNVGAQFVMNEDYMVPPLLPLLQQQCSNSLGSGSGFAATADGVWKTQTQRRQSEL